MTLKNDGYTIIQGLLSHEQLETVRRRIDEFLTLEGKTIQDPLADYYMGFQLHSGVIHDVYQRFEFFRPIAERAELLNLVESELGNSFYLYGSNFLYKPQERENEVPWHQDYLSRPLESQKLIAWVALDDATRENGCLKVIPGSHLGGFREWHRVKGATHHDRITLSEEDQASARYVEMKAGDALLFSNYLVHSSEQSESVLPRRAFRAAYKRLDDARIPRGAPIMMRSDLDTYIEKITPNHSFKKIRKLAHRVGRKLLEL